MPIQKVDVSTFIALSGSYPVFDVRSPSEYAYAHIPGAFSLPLFSDEQRKEIGTTYKQVSKEDAIKIGLKYFGPQLNNYLAEVDKITAKQPERKILVHCWRGGMRSGAMAWLLGFCGYDVMLLEGGYKAYRNEVLKRLELPFKFNVLGGFTGSGKTEVLQFLKKQQPVIDLEQLAAHKGSAFGGLGMREQPSQEYFENMLLHELSPYFQLSDEGLFKQNQPIWVENESQRIGLISLPNAFYNQIQQGRLISLDIPFLPRLNYINLNYGRFKQKELISSVLRIQKKLGGLAAKNAINFLLEDNTLSCFEILLRYYDKCYLEAHEKSPRKREFILTNIIDPEINAQKILSYINLHQDE